jgi:hypothetical protein
MRMFSTLEVPICPWTTARSINQEPDSLFWAKTSKIAAYHVTVPGAFLGTGSSPKRS